MYSSVSKLDRDIACSLLNAPSNLLSYVPIPMRTKAKHKMRGSSPSLYKKENFFDDILPSPHRHASLGFSTNKKLVPKYYDLILDTVTDYDIFYPIAKQTERYYYTSNDEQQSVTNEKSIHPRYQVQRLDELAVTMDFPHDYDSTSTWSNHPIENHEFQNDYIHSIKNVRFNDDPTCLPYSRNERESSSFPLDQYYFYSEPLAHVNNHPPYVRYVTTPFFWFNPVLQHNYALCIPTSRPSLHTYITPVFEPYSPPGQTHSTPNPIRL